MAKRSLPSGESRKLGTFGGVFTPSLLTILGLVLFLRVGFVTGSVGLGLMLVILVLATSVSVLTSLSLAAIATNFRVGGGGVYYLISRTLGPAFGGAIGLVLYLSIAVSVAFYSIGLGEGVAGMVGTEDALFPRLVAVAVIIGLLGLAWLGADIATRLQFFVMACLVLALGAYFVGVIPDLSISQAGDNFARPDSGNSFWVSYAIFFPAITGFTQGVAMSGDLRTPSRSIAIGTFSAVGISTLVYLAVIVTFALAVPLDELRDDTTVMRRLAVSPVLIDIGVIAATLSSAIASILGAPRTLQRLAADRLIKPLEPLAVGSGRDDNPRRAVVLTVAIALVTVALGDLDVIAPVISMFFLVTFGMINYATYSGARSANTSFRPTFRFYGWRASLLGTVACAGTVIAINPVAGAIAGASVFALYRYLAGSVRQARWDDATQGLHVAQVRTHLLSMQPLMPSEREWRPVSVVFVSRNPERRRRLISVASWFEGNAGFTTAVRILPGRGPIARRHAATVKIEFERELDQHQPGVYGRVIVADGLETGVQAVLQAHGIGALAPNLALFNAHDPNADKDPVDDYELGLQTAVRFGCNLGLVQADPDTWARIEQTPAAERSIVVWWSDDRNGQFLTLLAWLCTRSTAWARADIEIWVDDLDPDHVRSLLDDARIDAEVMGQAEPERLPAIAAQAGMVLAPLRLQRGTPLGPGDTPIADLANALPLTVFVHAASDVDLDVQPDEGLVATLAEARDTADKATRRADELDRTASALMVEAELLRLDYERDGRPPDSQLEAARTAAQEAHRRYVDARTRADQALRLVQEISPTDPGRRPGPEIWQSPNMPRT